MKDFELQEDEHDTGNLRKFVERLVLAAWIVTAIAAILTIIARHYSGGS